MKEKDNKIQILVAVMLGVAGLLIILIFLFIRSQSYTTTESVMPVDNIFPTFESFQIGTTPGGNEVLNASPTSSINLTEGSATTIYVNGTIQDLNGCEDVDSKDSDGILAISTPSNYVGGLSNILPNPTSTYASLLASRGGGSNDFGICTFSNCAGPSDVDVDFECVFDYEHQADSTTTNTPKGIGESLYWITRAQVRDVALTKEGVDGVWSTSTFEMNLLTSINVESSVDYGSISFDTTSTEQTLVIKNTGNDNTTDIVIVGADMLCTTGVIPVWQQRYDLLPGTYGTALVDVTTTPVDANLAKEQFTATAATVPMYWDLFVPTQKDGDSVSGICAGTTVLYGTAY